jgi:DNA repair protein RadC
MKFGAVRDVNSLSALMIARDDHDGALSAAPKPRHHLQAFFRKILKYQCDNERRGMTHNHPSGSPQPSKQDIQITRNIMEAGKRLGISVHDHLIIGTEGYSSMRAMGLF